MDPHQCRPTSSNATARFPPEPTCSPSAHRPANRTARSRRPRRLRGRAAGRSVAYIDASALVEAEAAALMAELLRIQCSAAIDSSSRLPQSRPGLSRRERLGTHAATALCQPREIDGASERC